MADRGGTLRNAEAGTLNDELKAAGFQFIVQRSCFGVKKNFSSNPEPVC
jgi:hypothetical protein